jgi:hypothetical protein
MTIFSYTITPPRPNGRSAGILWARDLAEAQRRIGHPDARIVQLHPETEIGRPDPIRVRPRRMSHWHPRGDMNPAIVVAPNQTTIAPRRPDQLCQNVKTRLWVVKSSMTIARWPNRSLFRFGHISSDEDEVRGMKLARKCPKESHLLPGPQVNDRIAARANEPSSQVREPVKTRNVDDDPVADLEVPDLVDPELSGKDEAVAVASPHQQIVAAAAGEGIRPETAVQGIRPLVAMEVIRSAQAREPICSGSPRQAVGLQDPPKDRVVALPAVDPIDAEQIGEKEVCPRGSAIPAGIGINLPSETV